MVEVKVWPDGTWAYGDDQLPEDYSDDYMLVVVPDSIDIEDIDNLVSIIQNT